MLKIPRKTRYIIFGIALAVALIIGFAMPQIWLDEHQVLLLVLIVLPLALITLWMQSD